MNKWFIASKAVQTPTERKNWEDFSKDILEFKKNHYKL